MSALTVNASAWVVLDAQINVLIDAEAWSRTQQQQQQQEQHTISKHARSRSSGA
jgi:hypothetical protein